MYFSVPVVMGFVSTGQSPSLEITGEKNNNDKKNPARLGDQNRWIQINTSAHPALGAIELLNLLSSPPKKPLTSVFDVFLRRRSAASFFPVSQELALLRYESRPA